MSDCVTAGEEERNVKISPLKSKEIQLDVYAGTKEHRRNYLQKDVRLGAGKGGQNTKRKENGGKRNKDWKERVDIRKRN